MKIPIPFVPRAIVIWVEPDPRKSSWPRVSIGGLMILIALLAVVFGIQARRAAAQRQALATQQELQSLAQELSKRAVAAGPVIWLK